jgi:hypothetical protein
MTINKKTENKERNNLHGNKLGFKKRMQLIEKNTAFRIAHKLAINRAKKIVKNSSIQPQIKKDGKKILFDMIYGMYGTLIYWEGALAKALQLRGHDVKVLTCGKALTMCTSEYTIHRVHDDRTCKHCVDFSSEFLKTTGIPYATYKSYITDEEIENIKNKVSQLSKDKCQNFIYKDVEVGVLSKNATIRYFKGAIDPDEKYYLSVLHSELINSIIAIDVAEKILKKEKPDILISTHLGYSSWGSFAEYFAQKNVRICYPGGGYKKNVIGFDFNIRGDTDRKFKKYYEEYRKKKALTKKEDEELQEFLDKRFKGKEGDTATYGYENKEIKDELNTKKYKLTYAIFPNVAWDSSLLIANRVFNDVYEWVEYTIEQFVDKPDYQLIVKIHPGELSHQSENTVHDYIKYKFKKLPENIKIIPLGTKISPYSLFSKIDVGLIYNGTTGLEMTLYGLPVIVTGLARYGRKGFTYDVSTKQEYKKMLFRKLPNLNPEQIQMARIYSYFYFIKGFLPYNYVTKTGFFNNGWNVKSMDEFAEGKDEVIDKICDYITKNDILKLIT